MYWLWQVSIWQLQYSPVSCSAWTIHPDGRIPPLSHPASATRFGGRWVQPYSAIHPGAFQTPFSGWLQGKATTGIPRVLQCAGAQTWLQAEQPSAAERWEVFCATAPFEWHFPHGDKVRKNCGTELSIKTKNHPWKLVDIRAMDQSWRKKQPGAIFRILHQFIQAERWLIRRESDNNRKYWQQWESTKKSFIRLKHHTNECYT